MMNESRVDYIAIVKEYWTYLAPCGNWSTEKI